ncbi:MAG TPA: ATP-binding protein, partial [Vicinamibacterales bacterium]|nr:ATP-binding protein [Vicinamibacterales bacterium]
LLTRWQQQEHARYVTSAADREPEERGRLAASDLNDAAARGVPNALTLVALRTAPGSADVVVHAAADPDFAGMRITAGRGLVGRVMDTSVPIEGAVADCEPPLPSALARYGERALVAPVQGSSERPWGVVLAVQRRGSLFPDDDLKLLQQYGRYAATALEHAQLIADARARERRAAERRLREMESRMSLMLDSIKDYAMIVLDVDGVVVNWHVGARHVFGYTTEQMDNEPAAPLFSLTPTDFAALLDEARRVGMARREGPCLRADGARFIGATVIRPLEGGADDVLGFVAVTRDVTEQRDLETRLRQSQKMEAIGQLAGGIAHDFNNLLTAIQGYAEWLGQSIGDAHTLRPQVDEILRAAERAAGLTRQLLTFSRGQRLQPMVINLSRLLSDLLPMLRRVIGEHIEIAESAEQTAPVLGDRSQVEQVILNLVVNARDAMPSGGRLTLSIRSVWLDDHTAGDEVSPGPYVALTVADTGVGMDPRTQARIFEPFFTTKEIGHGTGLGLATVYGIVKQMGGLVRVTSRPAEGATFELFFPEASALEGVAPAESPREPLVGHETILLVEDDVAVRQFVMQVLERYGYQVLAAEHRAAAIALVGGHGGPIHLVITDVVMPGGSGTDLAKALADTAIDAPVLFMSGYNDAVVAADSHVDAVPFLQKPFGATDLLTRVRTMLDAAAR